MNEENIKNLEKSLFYNLFKSSMENTHTDFWGGLVKHYGIEAIKIFGLTPKDGEELKPENVKREWLRFDLYIETNKRIIVIENKIKTAYTNEQLEKYTERLKLKFGEEKIIDKRLVTFFEDPGFSAKGLADGWSALGYTDILDNLKSLNFDNQLVQEYIHILENLNTIFAEFKIFDEIYETDDNELYQSTIKQLEAISFDDIYKKYKTQQFAQYLREYWDNKVSIGSYFTSGQGAVAITVANINEKYDKESIFFVITLQGDKYKREIFIGTDTDFYNENRHELLSGKIISPKCLDEIKWLKLREEEKVHSSQRNMDGYNTFGLKGQYDHISKYRHFEIKKDIFGDLSYEKIAEYIKNDINMFEQEKAEIQQIFTREAVVK
jgi:hypothetical protein